MKYLQYVKTDDTGRCWWDTGIVPDLNTKVELSIRPTVQTSVSSSYCCQGYLGSQRGDDTPDSFQVRLYGWDWQGLWFRIGTTQVDYQPHSELFDTWISITLDKDNYTVNGNSYSVGASYMEENVRSLYIGGINNPNWNHKRAAFGTMFGEVKIWKSGVLVFDGIPAEDNGALGFYDEVSQTFKSNLGTGVPVAGPDASSISANASKTKLASAGETISIEVATENAWTLSTSGGSFLTFSSTGDTSGATITATAPDYSGSTPREEYLTFVDSVTSDEASLIITQKKYQSGQPFYLGGDEVAECYVGGSAVVEAYLGEDLVYSSGPFQGLRISPKTFTFTDNTLTASLKIKSSEDWTITTLPSWLSASSASGTSGETIITLTATSQSAATTDSIVVSTFNFTASASAEFSVGVPVLNIYRECDVNTQFSPYTAYVNNGNYLKYEICAKWTTSNLSAGQYLYQIGPSIPFFSCERFRSSHNPYCNIGNGNISDGPYDGGGLDHTWVIEVNNGTVNTYIDGSLESTRSVSGDWPSDNLQFAGNNSDSANIDFYYLKFYDSNNTLIADFRPDPSNAIIDLVSQNVYGKTGGSGSLTYRIDTI